MKQEVCRTEAWRKPAMKQPLDPLTAAEIIQISSLLKAQAANQGLHFKYINIIEPPKHELRSFILAERNGDSSHPRPARRASVLYYHRGTSDLFLAMVNVDLNHVESVQQLESRLHAQADVDEILAMRKLCLQHPRVLEAIKRFKIPDHMKVACDTWPYGRDSEDNHPRYVQVRALLKTNPSH